MKTILFPTDFSKNAIHASEYAGLLAKKLDAKVILLHAFSIPMVPANHTSYNVRFAIDSYRKTLSKDLEEFTDKFIKYTGMSRERVLSKIEYGFPKDKILEMAEDIVDSIIETVKFFFKNSNEANSSVDLKIKF